VETVYEVTYYRILTAVTGTGRPDIFTAKIVLEWDIFRWEKWKPWRNIWRL